jgi:two-component system chemotaxis sensor kinase CheA
MTPSDETLREFLVESHENLDALERDLVTIEAHPRDPQTLARIFRTIHTIKGTCGFLALPRLEAVAHAGESLLGDLRDGRLPWAPEITGGLLALVDAIRGILGAIESVGAEGEGDDAPLIARLRRLQAGEPEPAAPAAEADREPEAERAPAAAEAGRAEEPDRAAPGDAAHGNVRVDVGLLDKLMNLVGELVLARNQILQHAGSRGDAGLLGTSQRLNLITTELQEGVMKTRMQPIGTVWNRFPRVVRDLAVLCGKQVRIEMEGRETELDRTIIEAIKDPLTHLVRNAIDHGIEPPEARRAAGKRPEGLLRLRAYHESGQVNIEITDDGAGIDPARLAERAVQRGVLSREQAARMDDRELLQLVFVPGFSTAERVTNLSGRGVGMDVVKTNIEKIGGSVDLHSAPGEGMTLKVKIPLTLAIIPALIVTAGGDRYAIPQVNLLELVRLEGGAGGHEIEQIKGTPIHRLRGHLLPLVDLGKALGATAAEGGPAGDATNIVVLQADGRQFGLVVDGISDTEEIVVKPLGKHLKGIAQFAGATIMGDGRVALILDVPGIAQRAGLAAVARDLDREAAAGRAAAATTAAEAAAGRQAYLLFRLGADRRVAIPMSLVARLEEIPRAAVERAGGREVVQYRDQILPLVRLGETLGVAPSWADAGADEGAGGTMPVIVYRGRSRGIGLVVDEILDVVEEAPRIRRDAAGAGLLGSAVIQKHVTDLLDVAGLLGMAGLDAGDDEPAPGPFAAAAGEAYA